MAHDTILNAGSGGDEIVTIDLALNTYKTGSGKLPASCFYVSIDNTHAPTPVTWSNPFPISGTGVAGTPTAGVLTIQGITSMTPVKVDASGFTVPITGTVVVASLPAMTVTTVEGAATTLATGQVTVNTTAGGVLIAAARATRREIVVTNTGTVPVYLGNSGVTTTTGHLLPGIKGASVSLRWTGALYGKTASGSQVVTYAEEYN